MITFSLTDILSYNIKTGLSARGIVVHEDMPQPAWVFSEGEDCRYARTFAVPEIIDDNIDEVIDAITEEANKETGNFSLYKLDDTKFDATLRGEEISKVCQKIRFAVW